MKTKFMWAVGACFSFLFMSCGGGVDQAEYDRLAAERDSIAAAASDSRAELNELNAYLGDIASCVDSISTQEQVLLVNVDPETGRPLNRREIRDRIMLFSQIIGRQRARIAELTDSLNNNRGTASAEQIERLTNMITYLNQQLEAKEAQMASLRNELASSKRSIAELTENVASLNESNAQLNRENETLDRTVAEQTARMNEGYFLAKNKKELEDMGILKGGFMKKTKFEVGNVQLSKCQKIDIRHFNDVTLNSKKPKLLTQAPAGSYTFEKIDNEHTRFVILDTSAFWSISNVVVIQL